MAGAIAQLCRPPAPSDGTEGDGVVALHHPDPKE
jgi:hypothetical protein